MPVQRGGALRGPLILLAGLTTFLIYRVVSGTSPWLIGVVAAQMMVLVWLVAGRLGRGFRAALALAVGAIMMAAVFWLKLPARSVGLALGGACHGIAYTGLLIWFGGSLRACREPVVTGLARRMRKTMPVEVILYTRRVTVAWCIFFAGQLLTSLGLLVAAPVTVWWGFVNLWNLPLVVAMVLGEFACRAVLFRRQQRTGFIATLTAWRSVRGLPGGGS